MCRFHDTSFATAKAEASQVSRLVNCNGYDRRYFSIIIVHSRTSLCATIRGHVWEQSWERSVAYKIKSLITTT